MGSHSGRLRPTRSGTSSRLRSGMAIGMPRPKRTRVLEFSWARSHSCQGTFCSFIDPLLAVGAEQMQFFARRDRPDALANGGCDRTRYPHDYLARRQLAGIGGDALHLVLAGAVNEGLGPD